MFVSCRRSCGDSTGSAVGGAEEDDIGDGQRSNGGRFGSRAGNSGVDGGGGETRKMAAVTNTVTDGRDSSLATELRNDLPSKMSLPSVDADGLTRWII